jgi:hypothetical protein
MRPAAELMEAAAKNLYTEAKWSHNKTGEAHHSAHRGPHAAESVGPSMGSGQEFPQNLFHSVIHLAIFAGLFTAKPFERIAGWTNGKRPPPLTLVVSPLTKPPQLSSWVTLRNCMNITAPRMPS